MRNLFLSLVLANLLVLAWQYWVDPATEPAMSTGRGDLALFDATRVPSGAVAGANLPVYPEVAGINLRAGKCFRLGPLPDSTAAQQAAQNLAGRGIDATPIARDAPLWLGHWVQISGFGSVAAAETARDRLIAGGIADALLMQDGLQPMISLGVFRERTRADRVANMARNLGFVVGMRDRYRPGVEHWLLVRPRPGQSLAPSDLSLAGDRIMRTEPATCDGAGGAAATPGPALPGQDPELPVPSGPGEPL